MGLDRRLRVVGLASFRMSKPVGFEQPRLIFRGLDAEQEAPVPTIIAPSPIVPEFLGKYILGSF